VVKTVAPINVYVHEKTGDIYVLSYAVNFIKHFTANGSLVGYIGKDLVKGFYEAVNFATASSEDFNVFMVDSRRYRTLQRQIGDNNNMKIIASNSSLSRYKKNQFNELVKVQFDTRGNLLVLDFNNHRVQNFSKDKIICDTGYSPPRSLQYRTPSTYDGFQSYSNLIESLANKKKFDPLQYSNSSKYHRSGPYLNLIESSKNKETFKGTSSSVEKHSPINDIFYPDPSFRKPVQEPLDVIVQRLLSGGSTNVHKPLNVYSSGVGQPFNFNRYSSGFHQPLNSYSGGVGQPFNFNPYSSGFHQPLNSYSGGVRQPPKSHSVYVRPSRVKFGG
jgi:hypothetical protein